MTASHHRGILDKIETVIEEVLELVETIDEEPFPDSGNHIGFLQILLKTEVECSRLNGADEAEQARIVENYRKIDTKAKAQAYVKYMKDKIDATKQRAG